MQMHLDPVISGFSPDPSVCQVGDDYHAASSSFECFPGTPVSHSRDLVHLRLIGNVLDWPSRRAFPRFQTIGREMSLAPMRWGGVLTGDPDTHGRVYFNGYGRGFIYGGLVRGHH